MARSLLLGLLLLAPLPLLSAPKIVDLRATENDGRISVGFRLEEAFDSPEIRNALESGLPTMLTYEIALVRKREDWFDERLATTQIEVVATYNSVTREYLLNYRRNRRLVRSEVLSSIEELRGRMTTIREPELFPLEGYRPSQLRVMARAELLRRYVLHLIPWDVGTDWEKTRVQSGSSPR